MNAIMRGVNFFKMKKIESILAGISNIEDCHLNPVPVPDERELPVQFRNYEVSGFYSKCDGLVLFKGSDYELCVLGLDDLKKSNLLILGESFPEDISESWFAIAKGRSGEFISIDTSSNKFGYIYDSFIDRHAVAGSCPVIAKNFSEFLSRVLSAKGGEHYWLADDFVPYGDAYDE